MYVNFEVKGESYKLRLNTRAIVLLEKQLGCNPLTIFGDGSVIPTITTMVNILHASMQQYNHGISLNDAYDIFDNYLADGKTTIDFINVIFEVYRESGLIPKEGNNEKNA